MTTLWYFMLDGKLIGQEWLPSSYNLKRVREHLRHEGFSDHVEPVKDRFPDFQELKPIREKEN